MITPPDLSIFYDSSNTVSSGVDPSLRPAIPGQTSHVAWDKIQTKAQIRQRFKSNINGMHFVELRRNKFGDRQRPGICVKSILVVCCVMRQFKFFKL
jgi:hypothetical protein